MSAGAELAAARSLELLRLVLLYREARGLDLYEQLPAGLEFSEMIETIVDHEADQLQLPKRTEFPKCPVSAAAADPAARRGRLTASRNMGPVSALNQLSSAVSMVQWKK